MVQSYEVVIWFFGPRDRDSKSGLTILIFQFVLNCYLWRWSLPSSAGVSVLWAVTKVSPSHVPYHAKLRISQWQDVWLKLSRIKDRNNQKILCKILGVSRWAEFRLSTSKDHRRVILCDIEDVVTEELKVIWMDYKILVCWEVLTSHWRSYLSLKLTEEEKNGRSDYKFRLNKQTFKLLSQPLI